MSAEQFTGRTAAMRTSPWLASEDIEGTEPVCAIEAVFLHKDVAMDAGRKIPKLFAIKFAGKERQMVINSTNRKSLVAKFGNDVKQWIGKEITLFVKDGVRCPSGGTTKGIRIK